MTFEREAWRSSWRRARLSLRGLGARATQDALAVDLAASRQQGDPLEVRARIARLTGGDHRAWRLGWLSGDA